MHIEMKHIIGTLYEVTLRERLDILSIGSCDTETLCQLFGVDKSAVSKREIAYMSMIRNGKFSEILSWARSFVSDDYRHADQSIPFKAFLEGLPEEHSYNQILNFLRGR